MTGETCSITCDLVVLSLLFDFGSFLCLGEMGVGLALRLWIENQT